ncbi:hypothetical protein EB118_18565, partial [bacterium]|nr:hypothetical protein [bacterium]
SGKLGGTGSSGGTGGMFILPNGQRVPESQLPSLGYVLYQGKWYHQTQFPAPAGTDNTSPSWLAYLNTAIQTGTQLYTTGMAIYSSFQKDIKSTKVDWNNSVVTVRLVYGYATPTSGAIIYQGDINPTTKDTRTHQDQSIDISGNGQQTIIKFIKNGAIQKQATIDFYNEKLIGFDAGSVGISGIYIGAFDNIDTVTNMYGVGSIYDYNHPKGLTHCFDGTYSDSHKGACSYHGGAHEIKLKKGKRDYTGKGVYDHYVGYRKAYKKNWAKNNRASDKVVTL